MASTPNMSLGSTPLGVGNSRVGVGSNPLSPGGTLAFQRNSLIARLQSNISGGAKFGLSDGTSVPASQIEAAFTHSITTAVSKLFRLAQELKAAAGTLVSGSLQRDGTIDGLFSKRNARSSDSAVAVNAADNATMANYTVDVIQLAEQTESTVSAEAQVNGGVYLLDATSPPEMTTANTAQIRITTYAGGVATDTDITFSGGNNINNGDTNASALAVIANAINTSAAGADVQATVSTFGSSSRLILTSQTAGTDGRFDVSDLSGDIVSVTGIDTVSTAAQDAGNIVTINQQAIYRINGIENTSDVNYILIDPATSVVLSPAAQVNGGVYLLSATSPPDMTTANTAQIRITTYAGGVATDTDITFSGANNINNGDTNATALAVIANAINTSAAGADVQATVSTSGSSSRLILTSRTAGTDGQFDVSDLSGDIASVTGIDTVSTAAREDGNEDGTGRVLITFQAVTSETVQVGVNVSYDAEKVVNGVDALVNRVNELRDFVASRPDIITQGLVSRLDAASSQYRKQLQSIGISADTNGALRLDESTLRRALQERPRQVERTIGYVSGLASREQSVARQILDNSAITFAARPGPLDPGYQRALFEHQRGESFLLGGLFVDLLL